MVPLTGIILIIVVSLFRKDAERRRQDFLTAVIFTGYAIAGSMAQVGVYLLRPVTCDAALLRIDRAIGFDAMELSRLVSSYHWLMAVLIVVYVSLPFMIGLTWVIEQNPILRRVCIIGGCLCFFGYTLCPAVGPGLYDWRHNDPANFARNCLPSMHFGWSIALASNARSRWLRIALWCYAFLVALATLAVGEHYLIDLLAAVPFIACVQWLATVRLRHPLPVESEALEVAK